MGKGLYRAHRDELGEECARIDVGNPDIEAFLTRTTYTAKNYEPSFDDLPTLEQYKAQNS